MKHALLAGVIAALAACSTTEWEPANPPIQEEEEASGAGENMPTVG